MSKLELKPNRPVLEPATRPVIERQPRPVIERQPRVVIQSKPRVTIEARGRRMAVEEMLPAQALSLAILVIQYVIEEPDSKPPAEPEWLKDLATCQHTLIKMKARLTKPIDNGS